VNEYLPEPSVYSVAETARVQSLNGWATLLVDLKASVGKVTEYFASPKTSNINKFKLEISNYGTYLMRQKLLVVATSALTTARLPRPSLELVDCGTQMAGGVRLKVRSKA
jgi:hypothetical protein